MPATGLTLGDIFLAAHTANVVPDAYGVRWKLTKLDGWDDGWEGNNPSVDQRPQADGAWVAPQYAGPRIVHLGGSLDAASWDDVTRAWNRLLAQVPFRQLGTLRVSTGEGTEPELTALVRQHEKPVLTRIGGHGNFSLSLLAPDPRRYASSSRMVSLVLPLLSGGIAPPLTPPFTVTGSTTMSQATLLNDGTTTTYPVMLVVGPCPPATIANLTTGEARRVLDAVPAGQTLVIDELNGTATTGGQARRLLGTPVGLVPGANEIAFSADGYDAAASLSISYRSAWK
ncbi:MAG TPA: hypothetical protein VGE38_07190 [Nocardioides sp.]|uniref:hypothetical protein n=1 Tax=Nocardioides sp. TaxID=35761 RepID=UPI002ED7CB0B